MPRLLVYAVVARALLTAWRNRNRPTPQQIAAAARRELEAFQAQQRAVSRRFEVMAP